MSSDYFLNNADNCATLAEQATSDADRKRYVRMAESWRQLARTNDWLEGRVHPFTLEKQRENAA
jgi:hypothetical protein